MIFVTVGTHEQQFNRLVEYMDDWASAHEEEVVVQTGFSTYAPKHCEWKKLYSYREMVENVKKARITITHGGPSSFIMPLQEGRIPIVVPRNYAFDEHVNNHQIDFCRKVAKRQNNIILVEEIEKLGQIIERYDEICETMRNDLSSNNERFCKEFEKMVDLLVK